LLAVPGALPPAHPFIGNIELKVIVSSAVAVAVFAALAGCSSSKAPSASNQDDGVFTYLLDRKSEWVENKVDTLPPLPQASNLLPFNVSQNTPLTFAVDKTSLTVGSDGVVRYVVVATSPGGARNVNYEASAAIPTNGGATQASTTRRPAGIAARRSISGASRTAN